LAVLSVKCPTSLHHEFEILSYKDDAYGAYLYALAVVFIHGGVAIRGKIMAYKKDATAHYVDNQKFYRELKKYKAAVKKATTKKKPVPGVSDFIGECFLKIATHLSHRPNFVNYSYRDDMIADGVENCLQYVNNFNPDKSTNPFSYFTQVIFFAFLRRISKEKKHTYIKYKVAEHQVVTQGDYTVPDGGMDRTSKPMPGVNQPMLDYENMHAFINQFETQQETKRTKRQKPEPTVWDTSDDGDDEDA
jgi:hypothetical protein